MSEPIIIDAHHHVWNLAVRDQEWITGPDLAPLRRSFGLEDLRPQAERAAVTATVVVQTVTVAEETPELLAQAASDPLVAGVVGWTDLTAADVAERLAQLREMPGGEHLVGVRHQVQGEPDPDWLLRPEVLRGLAAVADAGLVYDLLVLPHQLPAATAAARRLPGLAFVLDHAGKPAVAVAELRPWASHVRTLAAEPNVSCKLSGLLTEADWERWSIEDLRPFADTVLDAFGPGRVMFGSDWPVCTLAADYATVVSTTRRLIARLDTHEQALVLAGTAGDVYRLRPPPRSTPRIPAQARRP
ncbi:amidohydrolase family protein [Kitasatospora sp. NPDC058406]|uniref:amidohydrolase family protein n=1 Tax=Kitasatospora sp. NPDC058406 TaxID=3346483 RepID=UPI00365715CB